MREVNSDKVVVIGGSGFMGSHTADELDKRGFEVFIFDHIASPWLSKDQKMIVGDILDSKLMEETVKGARYVYHYAGVADIGEAKDNPYHTINANVMGVTLALEAAVKAGAERFIYASSMYVFSSSGSFYRASKQAAEIIIKAYIERYQIDFTLLRYGSLYGPRSQSWNGLYRYVEQVVRKRRLCYNGTGKEVREYIHVEDAARLSVDILDEIHKNRAIIVTGHQVLNSDVLINMIFEIAGVKYNVNYVKDSINREHYETTPYRYNPERAMKLVPSEFIDIGQGIMDLVEEIHKKNGIY